MLSRLSLFAAAVVVSVAGCASNPDDDSAATDANAPAASEALVGTYWKLMTLDGEPVPVADNQREAHLVLDAQGRVSGSTGCNRLMGGYRLEGDTLTFTQLASTRMACPGEMATLEQGWLATLSETAHYSISGQSLVLKNAGDRTLARLKANALY
ncbi:META domain-containing protein [uncultured Salinicola sp.]|uniref:META domain-containing protein n=1 Tax=uncultured Salinicola sp. TaxID=1193542 RepID=UPI0026069A74|nr:META domain-containing protein [uncultured Salinicola sp.]